MDLKVRYTLLFTVAFGVLLSVFSSLVYIQVRNRLLVGAEQVLINHLEHESSHLDHPHGPSHSPESTTHHRDIFQRVWKNGTVVDDSFPRGVVDPTTDAANLVRSLEVREGKNVYSVLAYFDLSSTLEYLSTLRRILLAGCLLSLCLVVPMSLWLMKLVLAPFRGLSDGASQLTAKSLSFRFPASRHTDEYGSLVTSFNRLLDRLQGSFDQVSRFATNASHELRTPLAVIISQAEQIRRRPRNVEEYEKVIDKVLSRAILLKGVTKRLLSLAEIERVEQHKPTAPVPVVSSIREVVDSLRLARPEKTKNVEVNIDGRAELMAPPELFLCIVNNLVENAMKHSRDKVSVSVSENGDEFVLDIGDDGPGIAEEERVRVFEPFYKTGSLAGKTEGHGLGLSITKACVDAVKGKIELGNSSLGGLLVRVMIPRAAGV